MNLLCEIWDETRFRASEVISNVRCEEKTDAEMRMGHAERIVEYRSKYNAISPSQAKGSMLRVLVLHENWLGSTGRTGAEALRRLGCQVFDIDEQTIFPSATRLSSRAVRRMSRSVWVHELNDLVLKEAEWFRPGIFLAFKGQSLYVNTLRTLRTMGISLYNFFPDTSAFTHGRLLPKSLPEYDCIFYTKPFWYADVTKRVSLKAGYFLSHGYNPSLHCPVELDARDILDYGCDVSFIAIHSSYKEEILEGLVSLRPNLNFCIWGNGWKERCTSAALHQHIKGFPLVGERYIRAIQAARINLGIMNGPRYGASSGDHVTERSFQIPACGGFMLHQRNAEILDLYQEGEEMACFDSLEELVTKIDYFLSHPEERHRIARAGRLRCAPAYSFDNRMAELLRWHSNHSDSGNLPTASAKNAYASR